MEMTVIKVTIPRDVPRIERERILACSRRCINSSWSGRRSPHRQIVIHILIERHDAICQAVVRLARIDDDMRVDIHVLFVVFEVERPLSPHLRHHRARRRPPSPSSLTISMQTLPCHRERPCAHLRIRLVPLPTRNSRP